MKNYTTRSYWISLTLSILLLAACSQSSENKTYESSSTSTREFTINAQNEMVAVINLDSDNTLIRTNQSSFLGKLKREDKRKYYGDSDNLVYTVKYGDNSFKLRDANEQLLWKVKLYDDHIKVADNEEMNDSYRVGMSDDKIKVKKDDEELSRVDLSSSSSIAMAGEYSLMNFGNSLSSGVMMVDVIPERDRILLCAELIRLRK